TPPLKSGRFTIPGIGTKPRLRFVVTAAHEAPQALQAFRTLLGCDDMLAYLSLMASRLVAPHRVLKPTGSIYVYSDPTRGHYLKILLDSIFGND
ncbi:MAG: hypothetical protein ACHRXM_35045, partial [Isosphaerales bacterium]